MNSRPSTDSAQYFQFDAMYLDYLKSGDVTTIDHFFQYFSKAIARRVSRQSNSVYMTEDIQQDTFLRVLRALQRPGAIPQPEKFGAYVISISKNVLREHVRQGLRIAPASEEDERDTRLGPEALMQRAQLNQQVRRALETLSPLDRALVRAAATDKSHDDIARELCVKPACVRVYLCRARKRLRERLASRATNNLGDLELSKTSAHKGVVNLRWHRSQSADWRRGIAAVMMGFRIRRGQAAVTSFQTRTQLLRSRR